MEYFSSLQLARKCHPPRIKPLLMSPAIRVESNSIDGPGANIVGEIQIGIVPMMGINEINKFFKTFSIGFYL